MRSEYEPAAEDFAEIRSGVARKLFVDPSYRVFDAMTDMTNGAESFVRDIADQSGDFPLWTGGSLGRREMLPNSDIDLFVVYDDVDQPKSDIEITGVDKFELGHVDMNRLKHLMRFTLVDANRFIDGRSVGKKPATAVEKVVGEANTQDRQLANNISEYFFYRYFDFPHKTTPMGPNLKYSTGSTRDTIFFNMLARMDTDSFPYDRGERPELEEVMQHAEDAHGIRQPVDAINLLFLVKNAAISVYDATGDPRSRHVSSFSLSSIYSFCEPKLRALGVRDRDDFLRTYASARRELEVSVDALFEKTLSVHEASDRLEVVAAADKGHLPDIAIEAAVSDDTFPHSISSFAAWSALARGSSREAIDAMAEGLFDLPMDRTWGAFMALACSPVASSDTFERMADWLNSNEQGAYLTKLLTRNPAVPDSVRQAAVSNYRQKEIIT